MSSEIPKSFPQNQIDQELSSTSQNVPNPKKLKFNHENDQQIPPGTIPEKSDVLEFRPIDRELEPNVDVPSISIPDIIRILEKSAGNSTLHNLRQLSSGFYEHLSSQYWDRLNKKIGLHYNSLTDTSSIVSVTIDQKGEKKLTNIGGIMDVDSLSQTLRALELWNDRPPEYKKDEKMILNGPATNNVIAKASLHITHVEMEFPMVMTPVTDDGHGPTELIVSEFLNGFPKLTNLKLNVRVLEETGQDTYTKLLQGISGLNPYIKMTIDVKFITYFRANPEWKGLLEIFGAVNNMPNLCLLLRTPFSPQLLRIADGFKSEIYSPKLKICLEYDIINLEELKVFTTFVIQHQDIIEFLQIMIGWEWAVRLLSLSPNDEMELVRYLLDLSPFVSKMEITDSWNDASRNVLNFDTEWSKLTDLEISGYTHPLQKILSNAPNLKKLYLGIDPNRCLNMPSHLHLTELGKTQLEEIFGNLKGLNDFNFDMICRKRDENKIRASPEFKELLKEILGFPENFSIDVSVQPDSDSSTSDDIDSSGSDSDIGWA